jgi:hypothetical protein
MASASRVFGNSWQTQPRTILSTARNGTRLGLPRRSTMICCRNTSISASNAARGRTRSTTIPKISLQRSNIPQKIIRFCVSRQLDGIYDRDRASQLFQRRAIRDGRCPRWVKSVHFGMRERCPLAPKADIRLQVRLTLSCALDPRIDFTAQRPQNRWA